MSRALISFEGVIRVLMHPVASADVYITWTGLRVIASRDCDLTSDQGVCVRGCPEYPSRVRMLASSLSWSDELCLWISTVVVAQRAYMCMPAQLYIHPSRHQHLCTLSEAADELWITGGGAGSARCGLSSHRAEAQSVDGEGLFDKGQSGPAASE